MNANEIMWYTIYNFKYWTYVFAYYISENATRYCDFDGVWANFSDYMKCRHLEINYSESDLSVIYESYFYLYGYIISLVALIAAVLIFLYFK